MSDPELLIKEAQKKLAPGFRLGSLFGGGDSYRYEEAAELYQQAANLYKMRKEPLKAGANFEEAAKALRKSEAKDDAANVLVEAYKAYSGQSGPDAVRVMSEAIQLFTLRGQFRRAAKYQEDLGKTYEDLEDNKAAIQAYETAGEWYVQDQALAIANGAFVKAAALCGLDGQYSKAADLFEMVAAQCLKNDLTKFSVKEHYFRAGLCRLANNDTVACENALARYQDQSPDFAQTKEAGLLATLIESVKSGDEEQYSTALFEFDRTNRLDAWKTKVLLHVKETLSAQGDDLL